MSGLAPGRCSVCGYQGQPGEGICRRCRDMLWDRYGSAITHARWLRDQERRQDRQQQQQARKQRRSSGAQPQKSLRPGAGSIDQEHLL